MASGTCAVCSKPQTQPPHGHGVGIPGSKAPVGRPANMKDVKDMGPMPRTSPMVGSPPTKKGGK